MCKKSCKLQISIINKTHVFIKVCEYTNKQFSIGYLSKMCKFDDFSLSFFLILNRGNIHIY